MSGVLLPDERRRYRLALVLVLLAAFALRIAALVDWDVHHSDEVFQVLEPAHRLVFGTGIVAWEMQFGIRSWILPGVFAGVMAALRPLSDEPATYLLAIQLVCIALSLTVPAAAFVLGHRRFGLTGAVLAAAVPACWVDLVFFASHTLSEPIGAHLWLAGVLLVDAPQARRGRAAAGSALIVLAMLVRVQLAPAVLLALLWLWWARPDLRRPLLLGAAVAALFGGVLDTLTWGMPWQSIWRALDMNLRLGVSDSFGVSPIWWYGGLLVYCQTIGAVLLLGLAVVGARQAWLVALAAVLVLLPHSAIGHKEYRFIYPAIAFATVLAGLGFARLVAPLAAATGGVRTMCGAVGALALVSIGSALSPEYLELVRRNREPVVAVAATVRNLPGLCGVGFKTFWSYTGGYSFIHRPVPLFDVSEAPLWDRYQAGFNAVIYSKPAPPPEGAGYREVACFRGMCVAARVGGCGTAPVWTNDWRPRAIRQYSP